MWICAQLFLKGEMEKYFLGSADIAVNLTIEKGSWLIDINLGCVVDEGRGTVSLSSSGPYSPTAHLLRWFYAVHSKLGM